jgi:hypothetical protein
VSGILGILPGILPLHTSLLEGINNTINVIKRMAPTASATATTYSLQSEPPSPVFGDEPFFLGFRAVNGYLHYVHSTPPDSSNRASCPVFSAHAEYERAIIPARDIYGEYFSPRESASFKTKVMKRIQPRVIRLRG